MTERNDKKGKDKIRGGKSVVRHISADYEVGYKKPPKHSQFKKGESGNPAGRPPGSKNMAPIDNLDRLRDIILEEAARQIEVQEGGEAVTYPMVQAILRRLEHDAAKGKPGAQKTFLTLVANAEAARKRDFINLMETVVEYKINGTRRIDEWRRNGGKKPDLFPDPDDIIINLQTGQILIHGPVTKEEKEARDTILPRFRGMQQYVIEREKEFEELQDPIQRANLEAEIEYERGVLASFGEKLRSAGWI